MCSIRVPYCAGLVTIVAKALFLAVARTMHGPPMSTFSMHVAKSVGSLATASLKGYRFTTVMSMRRMPCFSFSASCFLVAVAGQDAAVDLRVEGLDAAVQDLRRAGVISNILHGAAELPELGGGAARGEDVDAVLGEVPAELLDAGLVEDGDQGGPDLHLVLDLASDSAEGRSAHCFQWKCWGFEWRGGPTGAMTLAA